MRREIERLQPDVIHILSEGVLWLNLILPTARKYGVATTVHDVTYHPGDRSSRRLPRPFSDWLIRRSDQVVVHGATLRAAAAAQYREVEDRLSVLPHIVLDRYRIIARERGLQKRLQGAVTILFFGRIYRYKGLDVLIRSIPLAAKHCADLRVVIAGEGEDFAAYRKQMADPAAFVVENRQIPDAEAAQLFTDADIVVLPYVEASQSGVLSIANAFARAVIVTDVGELGRSVKDGVSGLVVPPNDERALAAAIVTLASDPLLRERLGEAGRAAADATASPAIVAEQALQIYARVAEARRARSGAAAYVGHRAA